MEMDQPRDLVSEFYRQITEFDRLFTLESILIIELSFKRPQFQKVSKNELYLHFFKRYEQLSPG
jgi:hypothetical protein